jgi:thymidylate kinase
MTLVILEGANGVGKSTYAKRLEIAMNALTLRPFRSSGEFHFDGISQFERNLRTARVPFNSHVEDFYAADLLAKIEPKTKAKFVFDRSLPSALVYGGWPTRPMATCPDRRFMIDLWEAMLLPVQNKLYVWLDAQEDDCEDRMQVRFPGKLLPTFEELHNGFQNAFHLIKMPKLYIDTSLDGVVDGVDAILKAVWAGRSDSERPKP